MSGHYRVIKKTMNLSRIKQMPKSDLASVVADYHKIGFVFRPREILAY